MDTGFSSSFSQVHTKLCTVPNEPLKEHRHNNYFTFVIIVVTLPTRVLCQLVDVLHWLTEGSALRYVGVEILQVMRPVYMYVRTYTYGMHEPSSPIYVKYVNRRAGRRNVHGLLYM